jgi:VWFA-related protein
MRRKARGWSGAILAVACAAVAALVAQDQQPPRSQPTFRGGANVVRVDLYAMRDGRAVDDLKPSEVDVLEDGVKQTIDSFEHVVVRPPVSQELRAEPNNVPESRQMAADPRARIFVVFLDTYHTGFANAARMRAPLMQFIDRVVGQDDLVALMTPEMSAADVTLGRRTTVISKLLDQNTWGRRGRLADDDPIEQDYDACYYDEKAIATEMKARRREKLTLDALDDLIVHLGGLREERKAVLAVSEGWLQYGPNPALARLLKRDEGRIPPPPGIVDRGVARQGDRTTSSGGGRGKCEADRVALANMDNTLRLQQTTERANRVNVTFYPVGAQGLAVFDSDIGPDPPSPLQQDLANLRARQDGLRLLADQTDGVAIVNTNNVNGLLERVVDDLSSYYLLGYSSTNTKLDGRFRTAAIARSPPRNSRACHLRAAQRPRPRPPPPRACSRP